MVLTSLFSDKDGPFVHIYDTTKAAGSSFPTPENFNVQFGIAANTDAKVYQTHIHSKVERKIIGTFEFIFIQSGQMDVVFLDESAQVVGRASLVSQMAFLQTRGGHAIKTHPMTTFFELKQGPYFGNDTDKMAISFFEGQDSNDTR